MITVGDSSYNRHTHILATNVANFFFLFHNFFFGDQIISSSMEKETIKKSDTLVILGEKIDNFSLLLLSGCVCVEFHWIKMAIFLRFWKRKNHSLWDKNEKSEPKILLTQELNHSSEQWIHTHKRERERERERERIEYHHHHHCGVK